MGMINCSSKNKVTLYSTILVVLLIYFSNSIFVRYFIQSRYRTFILIAICCFFYFKLQKKIILRRNDFLFALILISLQLFTISFQGVHLADILMMFSIFTALLYSNIMKYQDFLTGYRNAIIFISWVSVAIFVIIYLCPFLLKVLPDIFLIPTDSNNITFIAFASFAIRDVEHYYRNFGIFSEPGQYQIFLCIGLIIELFYVNKINYKNLLIILVALLTCNSANGFIVALFIFIAKFFESKKSYHQSIKAKRFHILLALVFVLSLLFIMYFRNEDIIRIFQDSLNKISELRFASNDLNEMGSGLERRRALDMALQLYSQHPLTGSGYRGLEEFRYDISKNVIIMTFSPLNWFAVYGTLYGIIVNVSFVSAFCIKPKNIFAKIFLMLGVLFLISAQSVNSDPFIWVLIFYGFHSLYERLTNREMLEYNTIHVKSEILKT